MKINHKLLIFGMLAASVTVAAGTAVSKPQAQQPQYVNLKVLPKNISSKDLNSIMINDFEDGLGVACNFCHAAGKETGELDFASDAKPEKEIARSMMKMMLGINKKYFKIKHPVLGGQGLVVTCNTCHNGVAFPEAH